MLRCSLHIYSTLSPRTLSKTRRSTPTTSSRASVCSVFSGSAGDSDGDCRIDLDIHVEMAKFARKVANTSPMKEMLVKELNPGLEVQTDEQLGGAFV